MWKLLNLARYCCICLIYVVLFETISPRIWPSKCPEVLGVRRVSAGRFGLSSSNLQFVARQCAVFAVVPARLARAFLPLLLVFTSAAYLAGCAGVASNAEVSQAPVISIQPSNQSAAPGGTATFTVRATGTAPLAYQWQINGTIIPDAFSSSYTTPPAKTSDNGSTFDVIVTNSVGSITSSAATLTVTGGAAQTITFGALPNVAYGAPPIALAATASSGLAISYTVVGPATLSGSTLTITGAGSITVTASQAGNSNFAAATPVPQVFAVSPALLTVTANNQSRPFGQANPTLTYAITGFVRGDSQTVVTGAPVSSTIATTGSAAGTYPITISAGTLAATNYTFTFVNGTLTVTGGAGQTITLAPLPNVMYGVAPITLTATASSGLAVSYTATGPATVSGSTLTISGAGSVTVTASQAGNANFAAAAPVPQTFTVATAVLTVTANNQSRLSGQPNPTLTYAITGFVNGDTQSVVSGTPTLSTTATTGSAAGTYPITISAGTLAATNYTFTFVNGTLTVTGGAAQTITFGPLPNVTYGVAPITLTATASSGLVVSYAATGPATVSGSTLTITGAGSVTVTASQAGNASFEAATPVPQTFTVTPEAQTITFGALPNVTYGVVPITLTATASSGLAVSYAVTSGPATVAGSTLTITGAGSVTVTASQAGNTNFGAATAVPQTFTVATAVLTVTANNLSVAVGLPIPTLTYTITGFVNGDTQGVVSGTPGLSTTATTGSTAGSYPITITAGTLAATNYTFTFVNGTLTLTSSSGNTYITSFASPPAPENPISEGGNWINGATTGVGWGNVQTTSGLAFGTNVSGAPPFNDSTAVLSGTWGSDQAATATVHSVNQNPSIFEEVELRLRTTITPNSITGYEINFRCTSDGSQYIGIVRWNGSLNDFTYITILVPLAARIA